MRNTPIEKLRYPEQVARDIVDAWRAWQTEPGSGDSWVDPLNTLGWHKLADLLEELE